jgi:hypothetical protein
LLHVEGPCFPYRFPQYGTDERKNAWKGEYKDWWKRQYRREIGAAENGWLTNSHLAEAALSRHNLAPRMIEAAVNSPDLDISRLTVRKQRLSIDDFAAALAHPRNSVFDLFDEEDADPDEQQRYLDDQARLRTDEGPNAVLDYLIEALKQARKIVASRNKVFIIN